MSENRKLIYKQIEKRGYMLAPFDDDMDVGVFANRFFHDKVKELGIEHDSSNDDESFLTKADMIGYKFKNQWAKLADTIQNFPWENMTEFKYFSDARYIMSIYRVREYDEDGDECIYYYLSVYPNANLINNIDYFYELINFPQAFGIFAFLMQELKLDRKPSFNFAELSDESSDAHMLKKLINSLTFEYDEDE